jgi:hypothetical protein
MPSTRKRVYRDRLRSNLGNLTDYWQALNRNRLNAAAGLRLLSAETAVADPLLNCSTGTRRLHMRNEG